MGLLLNDTREIDGITAREKLVFFQSLGETCDRRRFFFFR